MYARGARFRKGSVARALARPEPVHYPWGMFIIIASILLQFATAALALLHVRRTGALRSWLFIAAALVLMGVRRGIALFRVLGAGELKVDYPLESVALVISILMLVGVAGIGKVFGSLREAEARVRDLLADKDALLKETHHRLKNNMNVAGALLRGQADCLEAGPARETLLVTAGKVESMMLLYDRVYRQEYYRDVPARDYLPALVREIVDSFGRTASTRLEFDLDDEAVPTRAMFYVGLMINELVSNCMKHAFPGGRTGTVRVRMRRDGGLLRFSVQDDGVGFPAECPDGDGPRGGFGMTLLRNLAEQLGGELIASGEGGSRFEFSVPSPLTSP